MRCNLPRKASRIPLFQGLPDYQQVFHWHEDIFDIPRGGVKLATSENTPNQAFRVGRRAYGIQYHMELTPAMLDNWLHFPDYMKEIVKVSGQEALDELERERITRYPIFLEYSRIVFKNFLRISGLHLTIWKKLKRRLCSTVFSAFSRLLAISLFFLYHFLLYLLTTYPNNIL